MDAERQQIASKLEAGETCTYVEHGDSMFPYLQDGSTVTVAPCKVSDVQPRDVVFCQVGDRFYLHFVKAVSPDGQVQIGDAGGDLQGWTSKVFGKLTMSVYR